LTASSRTEPASTGTPPAALGARRPGCPCTSEPDTRGCTALPATATPALRSAPVHPRLHRFLWTAWTARPLLATAETALALIDGVLPALGLWAGRGLVNAIAGALAGHTAATAGALAHWAAALVLVAVAANMARTALEDVSVRIQPWVGMLLERQMLGAAAGR